MDSRTGIYHHQTHTHQQCDGEIIYNGNYWCENCSKVIDPDRHPAVYAGLFKSRYPKGNYEDHPNFDQELYRDGVVEIESFKDQVR